MHRQINQKHGMWLLFVTAFLTISVLCQNVAFAQVTNAGAVTIFSAPNAAVDVDFVHAKPMPLPGNPLAVDTTQAMIQALVSAPALGTPGSSPGSAGTGGATSPVFLGTPAAAAEPTPEDFGTFNHPFTTERADLFGLNTNTVYPYRVAGQLFFKIGASTFICSASLIKRGVIVTAAHCVANYGQKQFYSGWQFIPGRRGSVAPFGIYGYKTAVILTKYYNGTDGCAVNGVVCPDDVAVIVLNGTPGNSLGWYGYGWNGYGFTPNHLTQITQEGYPVGLDSAQYMERNDSYGYVNFGLSNNTIIGTNMNGGSSGGPWLVNFGLPAALTGETNGFAPAPEIVVGVTSWGYTSTAPKEGGAAPFTSGNILPVIGTACALFPGNC